MRIAVVTGATSFLGSSLIRELVKRKYKVIGVIRKDSPNSYRLTGIGKLELVRLDLSEIQRLPEYVSRADMFFHFGWDGSGSEGRKNKEVQAENFKYSMNALKAAGKIGCKTFVFAGSQAEYGTYSGAIKEEYECHPISEYGKQKFAFGRNGYKEASKYDMNFIHMRIFSVYGYNDRPDTLVNTCIDTFEKGGNIQLGKCIQLWNYLYIDDFVNIAVNLAEYRNFDFKDELDCIFNVGAIECKPLKEFVYEIYENSSKMGNFSIGAREENAEGSPSIVPDTTKLFDTIPYKIKYSFGEGIRRIKEMKFRKKCIVCGEILGNEPLLVFRNMPRSAQDIPLLNELENEKSIDLRLHQCEKCGLVQFDCEPVSYYKDVIRSGGFTTTMTSLRRNQYAYLIQKYQLEGKKILEVGCGQGEFLELLREFNVEPWGIENKAELVDLAKGKGLNVVQGFITDEENLVEKQGPFSAFLSFNFLEHQPDPNKMLQCIHNNLTDDGIGLITVPSLEYIMQHDGFYEFIRDHIAYYSFETLKFLVNKNGFEVLEEEIVNNDTLSIIVRKRRRLDLKRIEDSYTNIRNSFDDFLGQCKEKGQKVAIWGASHQGFTIASSLQLGDDVDYIVDSAPFKQGRYAPASHLPIVSPEYFVENQVDVVIIIAPGYTEEIQKRILELYGKRKVNIYALRTNQLERL